MELVHESSSGSPDQSIVKGKRTKRPRPSSSASSNGGADRSDLCNSGLVPSPTSSGLSTSTEEDEDMANCLILLARGGSLPRREAQNKLSSRKFAEMATTTDGKVGIYVYECKTCNRTFPSFQALGGHRASHKRPKIAADNADRKKSLTETPPADLKKEAALCSTAKNTVSSPPASTQLPNKFLVVESKNKIHECAICGSEFASGQALGGHMRRHRSVPISNNNSGTSTDNDTSPHDVSEKARMIFELDLNLPAPPEDDQRREINHFTLNQRPRLVFSAAWPLVDCHY